MAREYKVQWVYSARNNQELADRYDQWAKDYDRDLEEDFGWSGHLRTSQVFAQHVPHVPTAVQPCVCGLGVPGCRPHSAKGGGRPI